tara:strand:- start:132 stop:1013 length:882 start_codon:yes stop_codon:yes gene_type:complete
MGQQTVNNLKNNNRNFDNVLDSFVNLQDGGQINADFLHMSKFDLGAQVMLGQQSDGSAFSGVAGETNQWNFRCGNTLSAVAIGDNQTLVGPALTTTGLDVSGDATNNDGWEFRGKSSLSLGKLNKDYFTVGTSPAFYIKCEFSVADISDVDKVVIGFAKDEAFNATVADYDELATIGILDGAGDVKTDTIINGGANVTTDLTDITDWTDGDIKGFIVKVSGTGEVTYLISDNGDNSGVAGATYAASTDAAAYSFDNGEVVTPYWYHIHAAASSAGIVWRSFEFGLQEGANLPG